MAKEIHVVHKGVECVVLEFRYRDNDRVALELVTAKNDPNDECCPAGSRWLTATTNLWDATLGDREVFIKTWSENEGVMEILIAAGVLRDTGRRVKTGFCKAAVCEYIGDIGFEYTKEILSRLQPSEE